MDQVGRSGVGVQPEVSVFEAIETARATRYFRPEPVSGDLLDALVYAATRAPSPMNSQAWDFIVVTDPAQRRRLADALEDFAPRLDAALGELSADNSELRRTMAGTKHLVSSLADVPAIILVTGGLAYPPGRPHERYTYSAIYTAAQNILIAARSLGLGAAFTTLHEVAEPQFRAVLGIPDDRIVGVTIPVGWPAGPFGPVKRKAIDLVIHRDRWTHPADR